MGLNVDGRFRVNPKKRETGSHAYFVVDLDCVGGISVIEGVVPVGWPFIYRI